VIGELTRRNLEGGAVGHFEVGSGFSPKVIKKITKTVGQDSYIHASLITAEDLIHFLQKYIAPLS